MGGEGALVVGDTRHEQNREEWAGVGGEVLRLCGSIIDKDGSFSVE